MTVLISPAEPDQMTAEGRMTVLRPGPLATLQDRGRFGYAHYGVTPSGPADPGSFRLANRLAGNAEGTAALEITLGGFAGVLTQGRWASLAGAPATVTVDGSRVADPYLFWIPAGASFEIGTPSTGLRSYLALSGGFTLEPVLGSLATDTLSGLGPPQLDSGMEIGLGEPRQPAWNTDTAFFRAPVGLITVQFRWGPRDALFSQEDRNALTTSAWTLSSDSNRVGTRLTGPPLGCRQGSLPSEGTPLGAIQIPPSGQPIIFMPDHPVTGGYPVIGVVTDDDISLIAQARPGSSLRFQPCD